MITRKEKRRAKEKASVFLKDTCIITNNVGRNMDIQCHSGETSDRKEKGYWKLEAVSQGSPCYKVTKNLAELCSSVSWKVERESDKIGY